MKYDFLIVGQGLSGSILAIQLEKLSKSFKIINSYKNKSSSKVAAGIMHPLALKRGTISWRGKEFYNFSKDFYNSFDKLNETNYFENHKLKRIFSSFEEQNNWIGKTADSNYEDLIAFNNLPIKKIKTPFGNGLIKKAHRLNVKDFLLFVKNKYQKNIINENFKSENLKIKEKVFNYQGISYLNIVLCQGVGAKTNDLFSYLPIIPNKGELLEIKSENLPKLILNSGVFSLPVGNNLFTIGATYNHQDRTDKNTLEAKEELMTKIGKILKLNDLQILHQKFGFRPTTSDRKPLLGEHPLLKNLFIINGMGSKAVLMAPLLINELLESIFENKQLDKLVDIKRFMKKVNSQTIQSVKKIFEN